MALATERTVCRCVISVILADVELVLLGFFPLSWTVDSSVCARWSNDTKSSSTKRRNAFSGIGKIVNRRDGSLWVDNASQYPIMQLHSASNRCIDLLLLLLLQQFISDPLMEITSFWNASMSSSCVWINELLMSI